jgi:hypothetical protein
MYAVEVGSLTAGKYDSVVEKKLAYLARFMPGKFLSPCALIRDSILFVSFRKITSLHLSDPCV